MLLPYLFTHTTSAREPKHKYASTLIFSENKDVEMRLQTLQENHRVVHFTNLCCKSNCIVYDTCKAQGRVYNTIVLPQVEHKQRKQEPDWFSPLLVGKLVALTWT